MKVSLSLLDNITGSWYYFCPPLSRKDGDINLIRLSVSQPIRHKNCNFHHNLIRGRIVTFHMFIPCNEAFPLVPNFVYLDLWPTYLRTVNIYHNFWTIGDSVFILHMYIPCDETFQSIPILLNV